MKYFLFHGGKKGGHKTFFIVCAFIVKQIHKKEKQVKQGKNVLKSGLTVPDTASNFFPFIIPSQMSVSLELACERVESGLYGDIASAMIDMSTAALATAEYNKDFQRSTEQWSGNYVFRDREDAEFLTNIFGEIASSSAGSIVSARGNHYAGRPGDTVSPLVSD